jgi:LPXTG-motif cell wall-anchored protein/uncharacterized repeat protein (TIGR01451 family)
MMVQKLLLIPAIAVIATASLAQVAYAWHPEGKITKQVQNLTTNSALVEADTDSAAVTAEPGHILRYVITIKNTAKPAEKQYNDLAFIKMTDTLPTGVELVSSPSQRVITEDFKGTVLTPGKSLTREYKVKVVSKTNKQVIENKACFEGDSVVKDNKQKGCDVANVKVKVPVVPKEEPKEPVKPEPKVPVVPEEKPVTPAPAVPVELPQTGSSLMAIANTIGVSALAFTALAFIRSRNL